MIEKELLTKAVEERLTEEQFVTEISVNETNKTILVEVDADKGVSIDFCVEMTNFLHERFAEELDEYDLEVSSAGIGQPLKNVRQYQKFEGEEVEVLTADGRKLKGVLRTPSDKGFSLDVVVKIKPEGAKRKIETTQTLNFNYEEIKYTKYLIKF